MTSDQITAAAAVVAAIAAAVNVVLLVVLVRATIFYAKQTEATVEELREGRFAAFLPMLQWQSPSVGYRGSAEALDLDLYILLTNAGPGPARVLELRATSKFSALDFAVPSTVPERERITLHLRATRRPRDFPGPIQCAITLRYADFAGLREWETQTIVDMTFREDGTSTVNAFRSDERSAEQRRVR